MSIKIAIECLMNSYLLVLSASCVSNQSHYFNNYITIAYPHIITDISYNYSYISGAHTHTHTILCKKRVQTIYVNTFQIRIYYYY